MVWSLILALLAVCGTAAAIRWDGGLGCYVDDAGKPVTDYWDESAGLYIDAEGVAHQIENTDGKGADPEQGGGGMEVGGDDYVPPAAEPEEPSATMAPDEWNAKLQRYARKNGVTTGTEYTDDDGKSYPAEIEYLGLGRSMIIKDGQRMLVATSSLTWDTDAPEGKRLAVVSAAKQGSAKMRATKSKKAFVMEQIRTGQVLRVIKTGRNWTMVDHNGLRGYVLTGSLTFFDNAPRTYAEGCISYKGRTTGSATVYVRSAAKNSGRHLAEYAVGTPLTIFSMDEKWCEVDVEGWHCYILTQYVTAGENVSADAVDGTDAGDPG